MATWNNFAPPSSISSFSTHSSLQWRRRCLLVPSFSSAAPSSSSSAFNRGIRLAPRRGSSVGCRLVVDEGDEEADTKRKKKNKGMDRVGEKRLVRTLLVDNYDSYTYNIYQDLSVINGVPPVVIHNDDWTWEYIQHQLYVEKAFDNIVISPGPGSPGCPEDVGVCLQILMECEDIPILGVCLGHQALAFVHGAQIIHAPEPIHGRLSEIEHSGCNLFKDIPSGSKSGFKVVRYHSLVIDHNTLPNHLLPVAWTSSIDKPSLLEVQNRDVIYHLPHNRNNPPLLNDRNVENVTQMFSNRTRVLMGIRHSNRPHYGVQFHPESIATCHGRKIFENFREITVKYGLRSSAHHKRKISLTQERPEETKGNNPLSKTINGNYLRVQNQSTLLHKIMDIKYLKLQWKKLDGLANQVGGTENIFMELFGRQNGNDTFWLDSSSTDMRRARFSFMGGKGGHLWKQITYRLSDDSDQRTNRGGYMAIQDAIGYEKRTYLKNGFLEFLNQELKSFCYDKDDYKNLPFDFHGGFVGFIGYNMKVECGALSNNHKSGTPDACFFFADNLVVVDHSNDDVYILSVHDAIHSLGLQEQSFNEHWLDETEVKLLNLRTLVATKKLNKKKTHFSSSTSTVPTTFFIEKTRHQYVKDVEKCLQLIHDGESYELCLTTQMKMRVKDINSLALYRDLRNRNPAPYAAWLNFSKEKLSVCCSSPERFLQLDGNGILEAKPIKGTIARGSTLEEDEHLKFQLQHSEKNQAENLMIVDLLRNDLGRVCEPGTVHVPRLMEAESYATVHTLVSTIRGTKISNASPVDCVRASFPGGSMTGAPKLRSMELLDSLECSSRGIYSGSIGFFSYNQTFDLNIVIRTIVIHNEEASIGAGGAVIALSNPDEEYDEMMLKAKAPTKAVVNVQLNQLNSSDNRFMVAK